jgi:translation initiation factor IF-3
LQRKRKGFKRKVNPKFLYKINRQIRHQTVRLVGENIETGVYDIREAQRLANELALDLVEISSKADPPVCQVVDFNKFLYEKKKKEKELKSKQVKTVIKEIRFTPNTDDHDFEFKAKHAMKFLEEGNKVKAFVHFKGRNIVFKDRGQMILLRFAQDLEEYGVPEQMPQLEGRRMFMFLAPKKSSKGKKAKTEGVEKKTRKEEKKEKAASKAENAEAELKAAEAAVNTSEAAVNTSEAEVKPSEAEVKTPEAEVKTPEVEVKPSETEVKAPEKELKVAEVETKVPDAPEPLDTPKVKE